MTYTCINLHIFTQFTRTTEERERERSKYKQQNVLFGIINRLIIKVNIKVKQEANRP